MSNSLQLLKEVEAGTISADEAAQLWRLESGRIKEREEILTSVTARDLARFITENGGAYASPANSPNYLEERTENNIRVSCPNPDHPDKHPSCMVLTSFESGRSIAVFKCFSRCGLKGDVFTWASIATKKTGELALRRYLSKRLAEVGK